MPPAEFPLMRRIGKDKVNLNGKVRMDGRILCSSFNNVLVVLVISKTQEMFS
jgi:hypothetical protein